MSSKKYGNTNIFQVRIAVFPPFSPIFARFLSVFRIRVCLDIHSGWVYDTGSGLFSREGSRYWNASEGSGTEILFVRWSICFWPVSASLCVPRWFWIFLLRIQFGIWRSTPSPFWQFCLPRSAGSPGCGWTGSGCRSRLWNAGILKKSRSEPSETWLII